MSETTTEKNQAYESLSPQRKQLVDTVLFNLEKGAGIWAPDRVMPDAPESAITGKKYRDINNFFLSLIAMPRGYTDNRRATFKQIEKKGFQDRRGGNSLAKGKGAAIEYFEFRDKRANSLTTSAPAMA